MPVILIASIRITIVAAVVVMVVFFGSINRRGVGISIVVIALHDAIAIAAVILTRRVAIAAVILARRVVVAGVIILP